MDEVNENEVREQIDTIRGDSASAYNNPRHPGHRAAVSHVEGLYNKLFPAEGSGSKASHEAPQVNEQVLAAQKQINNLKANKNFMSKYIAGDKKAKAKMTNLYQLGNPELDENGELVKPSGLDDEEGDEEEEGEEEILQQIRNHPTVDALVSLAEAGEIDELAIELESALEEKGIELTDGDRRGLSWLKEIAEPASESDREWLADLTLWVGHKLSAY